MKRSKTLTIILIFICMLIIAACEKEEVIKEKDIKEKDIKYETKDLVINTSKQCDVGMIIVETEGVRRFEYIGEINIVNDGKDGNPIKIMVKEAVR